MMSCYIVSLLMCKGLAYMRGTIVAECFAIDRSGMIQSCTGMPGCLIYPEIIFWASVCVGELEQDLRFLTQPCIGETWFPFLLCGVSLM